MKEETMGTYDHYSTCEFEVSNSHVDRVSAITRNRILLCLVTIKKHIFYELAKYCDWLRASDQSSFEFIVPRGSPNEKRGGSSYAGKDAVLIVSLNLTFVFPAVQAGIK